ncbi:MAG: GNAT family N-acetyltransferase [Chloroflexi bacterium]|nr:GNAT family N-acetyltransferase [Chloroflexota bacterium]
MEVEIRRLTDNDAVAYWEVRLRALLEDSRAFGASYDESVQRPFESVVERFRTDWAAPDNFILGAYTDRLVGIVGFYREKYVKMWHKGTITQMYVVAEARSQGIGRALLVEAISRAAALPDLEQINLTVVSDNVPARALYESVGFQTYGLEIRAMRVDQEYVDEVHMVLRLDH